MDNISVILNEFSGETESQLALILMGLDESLLTLSRSVSVLVLVVLTLEEMSFSNPFC